jgi:hypothetical protein
MERGRTMLPNAVVELRFVLPLKETRCVQCALRRVFLVVSAADSSIPLRFLLRSSDVEHSLFV